MHLTESSLREPAGRAARVAALELVAKVRANRDRLDDPTDGEALHDFRVSVRRLRSWLRAFDSVFDDTLSPKTPRRLQRIARATGASRDLEVHLAWSEERRRTLRGALRRGADWLIGRLSEQKAAADLELQRIVSAEFDRATKRVETAMSRYSASVVEPEVPFAAVAARLVRRHAAALTKALALVTDMGDRAEAHEARIAAKRLRYLLGPLDHALPDVEAIVDDLAEMQDRLGELHDAQIFGSQIASIVAERLADTVKVPPLAGERQPTVAEAPLANDHDDPVPGLLAFARRLRRAEEKAFAAVQESWLNDHAAELLERVAGVAAALDTIAKRGREIRRKYLLRSLPADMPAPVLDAEIDAGYVPGDRIDERVCRVTSGEDTQYYRILNAEVHGGRVEIEDSIAERAYAAVWPLTKGSRVRMRVFHIDANDQLWTVYQFLDRELVLAAVELDDADEIPSLPEWIEAVVERDVNDDKTFSDRALAK